MNIKKIEEFKHFIYCIQFKTIVSRTNCIFGEPKQKFKQKKYILTKILFKEKLLLHVITSLIIKITISSIVIGLKKLLFRTNSLAKLLSESLLSDTQLVIGQFNKPITFKVVV